MEAPALFAASGSSADRLLLALAVVVVSAWVMGRAVRSIGQPAVLGEILAGILLGPSFLGALAPGVADVLIPHEVLPGLGAIADIGLVLFMFLVGVEVDLTLMRGTGARAVVISQVSMVVPLLAGFAVSPLLASVLMPDAHQPGFGLFIGAAMGITAFPVLARLLQELRLDRTEPGTLALACAAIGDVVAWCLLAAVVAVVEATGPTQVLIAVLSGVGFTAAVLVVVRPLLARVGSLPLAIVVALTLAGAWITSQMGLHAIFGAFLVGVAMPRDDDRVREVANGLEGVTTAVLLPTFFVVAGLAVHVQSLATWAAVFVTVAVVLVAILSKVGAVAVAGRTLRMGWSDAIGVGLLMNTRGLTEIVILAVGLQLGVIDDALYTAMVVMALATTFMAAPVLESMGIAPRWRTAADAG